MPVFSGSDWIVVIGALGAALAGVVGAWLTHRRPPPEPAEHESASARRAVVHLHDDDRSLLAKVVDTIARGVTRIEDALADHRRAIEDAADHLRRHRKD